MAEGKKNPLEGYTIPRVARLQSVIVVPRKYPQQEPAGKARQDANRFLNKTSCREHRRQCQEKYDRKLMPTNSSTNANLSQSSPALFPPQIPHVNVIQNPRILYSEATQTEPTLQQNATTQTETSHQTRRRRRIRCNFCRGRHSRQNCPALTTGQGQEIEESDGRTHPQEKLGPKAGSATPRNEDIEDFNVELSPPPFDIDELDMDFHITSTEFQEFEEQVE